MLFAFPPTPDPIGVSISIISGFISLFGAFRGGVTTAVRNALEQMRNQLVNLIEALERFAWRIARALRFLLEAFHRAWVEVINPILEIIAKTARRINQIVDKVLRPYLEAMERIRKAIDLIYNTIFRPILAPLESIRKILAIGRLLHIKAAQRLDDRILRIERKILTPIRILYGRVNETGGWLGVILTARAVLQQAVLLNSLYAYQGGWINLWYNAQTTPLDAQQAGRLAAARRLPAPGEGQAALELYATAGAGPFAQPTEAAMLRLRQILQV